MKHSEDPISKETSISDSIKLAIRDEVERRFDAPTASFVKLVEDEVRQRIRRQEWFYWLILVVSALGVYWYARTFWNTEISDIPKIVHQQLETEGSLAAQNEITNILLNVEQKNSKLNEIFASAQAHASDMQNSLNAILLVKAAADSVSNNLSELDSLEAQFFAKQNKLWILPFYSFLIGNLDPVVNYHLINGDENLTNIGLLPKKSREFFLHQWYVGAPWVLRNSDGETFTNNNSEIALEPGTVILQGTVYSIHQHFNNPFIFSIETSKNGHMPIVLWPKNDQTSVNLSQLHSPADFARAFSKPLNEITAISDDGVAFWPKGQP